jgi:hypothetical protein
VSEQQTIAETARRARRMRMFTTRRCVLGATFGALAAVLYLRRVEPWLRRWGATDEECTRRLPIDDLVESGGDVTTRALTVDAPIEVVWSWLVQIGQDRAGFYSYTVLENLIGANMHNANAVVPAWQHREGGDSNRGRASGAWGFFLHPETADRTRFLVRTSGGAVGTHGFDGLHFVMEQKMMRGLRDRAETHARATSSR